MVSGRRSRDKVSRNVPSIRYFCIRCKKFVTEQVASSHTCTRALCKPCTRAILKESFERSELGHVSAVYENIIKRRPRRAQTRTTKEASSRIPPEARTAQVREERNRASRSRRAAA